MTMTLGVAPTLEVKIQWLILNTKMLTITQSVDTLFDHKREHRRLPRVFSHRKRDTLIPEWDRRHYGFVPYSPIYRGAFKDSIGTKKAFYGLLRFMLLSTAIGQLKPATLAARTTTRGGHIWPNLTGFEEHGGRDFAAVCRPG